MSDSSKPDTTDAAKDAATEASGEVKKAIEEVSSEVKETVEDAVENTTTKPTDEELVVETTQAAELKSPASKSQLWQVGLIVAGLVAVFALTTSGIIDLRGSGNEALTGNTDPIALVNGEVITQGDYDQQFKQAEAVLNSLGGGAQTQDEVFMQELRGRIIDDLVNSELLHQKALEAGFAPTEDEIDAEFETTIEQVGGQEALEAQLATIGLDEDGLRDVITKQIAIEAFINENTDVEGVTVTDEEVQTLYDESTAEMDEEQKPPLDIVRPQIEAQIQQEKTGEIIQAFVETLREDAEIEILI